MTLTSAQILDGGVGFRRDRFEWEFCDDARNALFVLPVSVDARPSVRWDNTRTVARTATGVSITTPSLDGLDLRRHRVRPVMVMPNGDRFPLGVFMFGADNRNPRSLGTTWTPDLFDETFITDQPLPEPVGVGEGGPLLAFFVALAQTLGIVDINVDGVSEAKATSTIAHKAGDTGTSALRDAAAALGCYPPFFDNNGSYRLKPAPPPGTPADHVYESGTRIIEGSVVVTNSIYKAYNVYVTNSSAAGGALVGSYQLPASAPNSVENIGFRIVSPPHPISGAASVDTLNASAHVDAINDPNSYVQATFDSLPDPRHDGYHIVQLHGIAYAETGWSIECVGGGKMSHSLVGYYE